MRLLLVLLLLTHLINANYTLTVKIQGIKKAKGDMRVALFTTQASFDAKVANPQYFLIRPSTKQAMTFSFPNLPKGTYSLKVFQDRNYDQKLDLNAFGMPKEPFGFSNNAMGDFGPPEYKATTFVIQSDTTHTITLR